MEKFVFRVMEIQDVITHRNRVFTFTPGLGGQSTGKGVTTLSAAKVLDGLLSGPRAGDTRKSFHSLG